jgi:4-hydroxybenzoate polyprenyltransferase
MSLLRLIRFPNLIIVALTQFLLYYKIILPALQTQQISPTLPFEQLLLFILITVFITAGGYIINDIADVRIDLLNKPHRILIGRKISTATAYWLYFIVNLIGFLLAMYLALVGRRMSLLFIFPVAVVGLLAYSVWLKKRPLSGNILVSLYCAGVALIVWIAEAPALSQLRAPALDRVTHLLTYYAVFAFFSTLFREIVKDLEDAEGDAAAGARTVAIAWGVGAAKRLAGAVAGLLLLYLLYFGYNTFQKIPIVGTVAILFVTLMIGTGWFLLIKANNMQQYHQVSQLAKVMMLAGILLLLVF